MENEFERLESEVAVLQRNIDYWTEVLQKSEKYERLMQDPDFLEVLKDIDQTIKAHDGEIKKCLDGMSEYGPKMLADAQHTLFIHQVLKEQAMQGQKRAEQIVELAKEARKKIPDLQEKLKNMRETANA